MPSPSQILRKFAVYFAGRLHQPAPNVAVTEEVLVVLTVQARDDQQAVFIATVQLDRLLGNGEMPFRFVQCLCDEAKPTDREEGK